MDLDAIQHAIDAGNAQWIAAFKQQDAAMLANVFTTDGVMLSWRGDVTRGREAIRDRIGAAMQRLGPADVTISTLKMWPVDDLAYEHGAYTYTFRGEDGQPIHDAGRFVVIWQRQPDGSYRIAMDMGLPDEE